MSNPWDVPPWPTRGDEDAERTHAGIGGVVSVWSIIENELARLYTVYVDRYDDLSAQLEFGDEPYFRKRYLKLEDAAARYFMRKPHQAAEGYLSRISDLLSGFSARRNEIAHGIVSRVEQMGYFRDHLDPEVRGRPNYMVLPPFHVRKNHSPEHGGPTYAYNYQNMFEIRQDLFTIAVHIHDYLNTLLPPEQRDDYATGILAEQSSPQRGK